LVNIDLNVDNITHNINHENDQINLFNDSNPVNNKDKHDNSDDNKNEIELHDNNHERKVDNNKIEIEIEHSNSNVSNVDINKESTSSDDTRDKNNDIRVNNKNNLNKGTSESINTRNNDIRVNNEKNSIEINNEKNLIEINNNKINLSTHNNEMKNISNINHNFNEVSQNDNKINKTDINNHKNNSDNSYYILRNRKVLRKNTAMNSNKLLFKKFNNKNLKNKINKIESKPVRVKTNVSNNNNNEDIIINKLSSPSANILNKSQENKTKENDVKNKINETTKRNNLNKTKTNDNSNELNIKNNELNVKNDINLNLNNKIENSNNTEYNNSNNKSILLLNNISDSNKLNSSDSNTNKSQLSDSKLNKNNTKVNSHNNDNNKTTIKRINNKLIQKNKNKELKNKIKVKQVKDTVRIKRKTNHSINNKDENLPNDKQLKDTVRVKRKVNHSINNKDENLPNNNPNYQDEENYTRQSTTQDISSTQNGTHQKHTPENNHEDSTKQNVKKNISQRRKRKRKQNTQFDDYNYVNTRQNRKRKIRKETEISNKRQKPKALIAEAFLAIESNNLREPDNYKDIFNMSDKDEWLEAVDDELENMKRMNVYTVVNKVPKGANIITNRWVLKYKRSSEGKIIKRKARLVARGYAQVYGVDYINTFSPTLKQDTLRIIVAIAVHYNFSIHQMDIKAAYLNAELDVDIYMKLPEGDGRKGYCKLNKALYGLKQAGRMWNDTLNKVLLKLNFRRLKSDPCVYVKENKDNKIVCILAVYVDDIIITGKDEEINKTKKSIKDNFEATDVGEVDYIIGIKFVKCKDGYLIHQKKYLNDILNKFEINKYKPVSNTVPIENEQLRKSKFDNTKYRQAIGSLLYLALSTRPDILFSVSKASRKSENPTFEDWYNVIKIFRYLKENPNYGIKFTHKNKLDLRTYVDADLGGDKGTRRSTTGYIMMMNTAPTSWYSKLQHSVSTSTAESEYYGIHECARHCMWYKNILNELGFENKCITINTDNQAAKYICENETINSKSKHIELRYHNTRDLVREKKINIEYIKSENNLSDGFTKYLNTSLMNKFRNNILYKF